jgi:DNA-binding LacI/PurR family transcriptional regulator
MTIRNVAKAAGVSTATVSRVMGGSNFVKPENTKRVRDAIEALNYVPNQSARILSNGRSHLFGMVISDITNPFFPDLICTFNELAERYNYRTVFTNTSYSPARMGRCILGLMEQRVEGVAIMTSEVSESAVRLIADRGIPVVSLDARVDHENVYDIPVDYRAGMEQIIDHVLSLGHERIAFIAGPRCLGSAKLRRSIFLSSMQLKGARLEREFLVCGNHRVDGGHDAMSRLLKVRPLPTTVICSNDLSAIGAITAIYEAGLKVPLDISVVGFDDIEISRALNPALTTVRLSRTDIATRAFFALYLAANGLNEPRVLRDALHMVPTALVVRRSTASPPMVVQG